MPRILIVDESRLHRAIVVAALRESGYEMLEAADGPGALEKAGAHCPDLVLLDQLTPVIDGFEVCRRLKSDRFLRHIPVLMLTRSDSPLEKAKALNIGADGSIPKPFHREELRAIIEATLRWRYQYDLLTHLPASPLIREHIELRLRKGDEIAICLVDIDRFKAYNDYYGYECGDNVIKQLAHIIHMSANGSGERAFIGHLGGDDFVVVCGAPEVEEICDAIRRTFTQESPSFYTEEDLQRGYIGTLDRQGNVRRWPLMTLSIAATTNTKRPLEDYAQVGDILQELRDYLKGRGGNDFFIDRRTN